MFSGFCLPVTKSEWDINVDLVVIWGPGWGAVDIPTVTELYSLLDFPKKKNTVDYVSVSTVRLLPLEAEGGTATQAGRPTFPLT